MSVAIERIEASRARLKLAMYPPPRVLTDNAGHTSATWLSRFTEIPVVQAVVESVTSWWSHHPLRPVAQVASDASNAVVRPLAQRQPLGFVLVALIVGAGLAWSRPWRWIFRSALFAGLLPQIVSRVVSSVPIESWMSMVGASLSTPRAAQSAPGAAGTT